METCHGYVLWLLRVNKANEIPISRHTYIGYPDDIQKSLKLLKNRKRN